MAWSKLRVLGDSLENHALLPVVPSNICVDAGCSNRRGLSRKSLRWRLVESYCRMAIFFLCSMAVGAVTCQIVFGQGRSAADMVHDAIERTKQDLDMSNRISNLEFAVKEYKAENEQLRIRTSDLEKTQYITQGIGLSFMGSVAFMQLIKMVAGKKIKEDG